MLPIASFALAVVAAGCNNVDIIDHEPLIGAEGNFPGAAEERCGPLPDGVEPIAGLRSAWAMDQAPVQQRSSPFRVATTSMLLRFSDDVVPCEEPMASELLTCPHAWAVDITMRNAAPGRGSFALDDYGQHFDISTVERVDGDCKGQDIQGNDFGSGELEIFTVTADCVVGRLVDTADPLDDAGAVVEGGFVAMRCDPVP